MSTRRKPETVKTVTVENKDGVRLKYKPVSIPLRRWQMATVSGGWDGEASEPAGDKPCRITPGETVMVMAHDDSGVIALETFTEEQWFLATVAKVSRDESRWLFALVPEGQEAKP